MNPFEQYLKIKPAIESNPAIMESLRAYARMWPDDVMDTKRLDCLGIGTANIHFRLGKVGDLWLATREDARFADMAVSGRRLCEEYIAQAVISFENQHPVLGVCGAAVARFHGNNRYFLIIEDLTRGGSADFRPARLGQSAGTINGKPINYEFDDFTHLFYRPAMTYTADKHIIDLR